MVYRDVAPVEIVRAFPFALALVLAGCAARIEPPVPVDRTASPPTEPDAPSPPVLARPSGTLVYSTEVAGANDDVFSLDLADPGASPVRLTNGTDQAFDPDLAPDGRSIVYRVNPDPASDHADLWVIDRDGSDPRRLTTDPALDNWSPAWSPDGSRVAFASIRDGGTLRVWTVAPDGTDPRPVTRGHGEYPDWSPDGSRIVFAAPPLDAGFYDLWIVDAEGATDPVPLVADAGTQFSPAWSPDGEWIAYQSEVEDRWELWIIRPDGSNSRRVSPAGQDGVWPAWSPDGLLAWSGPRGVHVIDLASGATTAIAIPGGASFLSWGR
jgi:TolB protein